MFSRSLLHPYHMKNLDLDVAVVGVMEKGPSLWPTTQVEAVRQVYRTARGHAGRLDGEEWWLLARLV